MSKTRRIFYLLLTLMGIALLPYIGAKIHFNGEFPTNYFEFPTLTAAPKAGFSWTVFILIGISFFLTIVLYIYPRIFGFKKPPPATITAVPKVRLPKWFWIGLILWAGSLIAMWGHFSSPRWLVDWSIIPLFWGFTFMLDGWVYVRKGGKSIIKDRPKEMVGIGMASIGGWLIFEWLNFFVGENWLYPKGDLIPKVEFFMYALIGSAGLFPMAFEWYSLFNTLPNFRNKYNLGPKVHIPKWGRILLLLLAFASLFASSFYPDYLFFTLWTSPLIILAIVLSFLDIWTPFNAIKKGNWTPLLLIALTYLLQGFLCESWNYFSADHSGGGIGLTYDPDYWVYSIPYVNAYHIFEMPLLGYMGYLPFGIYSGVAWITFAYLLDIPTQFSKEGHRDV